MASAAESVSDAIISGRMTTLSHPADASVPAAFEAVIPWCRNAAHAIHPASCSFPAYHSAVFLDWVSSEPRDRTRTPTSGCGSPSLAVMAMAMRESLPRAVENLVATSWLPIIVHDPELSGRCSDLGMSLTVILPSAMARGRMQNVSTPCEYMSDMMENGSSSEPL
ncbi:MAG: hypothetical protein II933_04750 [Candidatus Methanomethylophilaceae archaeon]|nr:hypothetical protein [Candidatus Methanomethylophilaceae archaeon]